jgi:mitogen-activated protein kinase kinase kinase 7
MSESNVLGTLSLEPLGLIGAGTHAFVRKAIYQQEEPVAVKIFKKNDAKSRAEFLKEVQMLKRLSHPSIIRLIAFGKWREQNDSLNCMILELADLGSLYHVLYETELAYSLGHGLSWLRQLADAVNYLHTCEVKPILHRDLKPLNLLLTRGGRTLKVCDFGTVCDLKTLMSVDKVGHFYSMLHSTS